MKKMTIHSILHGMGSPQKGVGISNGAKGGIVSPLPFKDALFNLDKEKRIEIEMVYLYPPGNNVS